MTRPINSSCIQIPNELPNVISVAATGAQKLKAYYSNYSLKFVQASEICAVGLLASKLQFRTSR